jgi:hypothetical protein
MKRISLILVFMFMMATFSYAQLEKLDLAYKTAVGVRYTPFGVSLKINSSYKKRSSEIIGYFKDGFVGSYLYYWNFTLDRNYTMRFYVGGGLQGGYKNTDDGNYGMGGPAGVIGLDYKFKSLPINLSADWQPAYQIGQASEFKGNYGGVAVRFAF